MNVHDSERLAGLLEEAGYAKAAGDLADVVVFNTCAVRENADNKLYGTLGLLRRDKKTHPDMQIAVGGCLAQKDRGEITRRAPWVDVVFGTHNIGSLPTLLERARVEEAAQVEIAESLETLPVHPADAARQRVRRLGVGQRRLQQHLHLLHRPVAARPRGGPPARRRARRDRDARRRGRAGGDAARAERERVRGRVRRPGAFAKLLRACGDVEGLERVRFTSPHPRDFTPDVIAAMAETPNVMPQLHMPLQSGSDRVLRAMRRSYRSDKYLRIIDDVRAALPQAAITTDIIVGFPGETEADFQATLDVAAASRFAAAFTFQYSIRPGTPAATMPDQVPRQVVQERYERLVALVEEVAWTENQTQVGRTLEVMFADGEGRKDGATARMSGRARDNRLVHVRVPEDPAGRPRPGDLADVVVTYAAPHHLTADEGLLDLRRTRGGDAWAARQAGGAAARPVVGLGLPSIGVPAPLAPVSACG